eukprot:m.285850 g.285850  ORF g.285850 m.285850 type:complete len:80 (+) comp149519_c0_seq1:3-242(+)
MTSFLTNMSLSSSLKPGRIRTASFSGTSSLPSGHNNGRLTAGSNGALPPRSNTMNSGQALRMMKSLGRPQDPRKLNSVI